MTIQLPEWMERDKISPILHGLWTTVPGLILGFTIAAPLGFVWVNWWWGFYGCKELGPKGDLQEAKAKGWKEKITDSGEDIAVPTLLAICANAALWAL